MKSLVSDDHSVWLSETIKDLKCTREVERGVPSQRKEIEEEVQIILEKIEPLIKDDILTELREKHGDPEFYFKVLFTSIYVKNPVRVSTYSNLKPSQLLKAKEILVTGTCLKYVVIHDHKTNASSGSAKVFFTIPEFEIWKWVMLKLDQRRVIYAADKTLRAHIKLAIEKVCDYKLKGLLFKAGCGDEMR